MSEWKTIDSAPKDGTAFLGFQATPGDWEGQMAVCWWSSFHDRAGPIDGFVLGQGGLYPTHWQPLPSLPEPVNE